MRLLGSSVIFRRYFLDVFVTSSSSHTNLYIVYFLYSTVVLNTPPLLRYSSYVALFPEKPFIYTLVKVRIM